MIEPDFLEMMIDVITLEPAQRDAQGRVMRDAYGQNLYSAPVQYRCRVGGRDRMVRTADSREIVSTKTVWLYGLLVNGDPLPGPAPTITAEDRITLPKGNYPLQPPILYVDDRTDMNGDYATALYLGG